MCCQDSASRVCTSISGMHEDVQRLTPVGRCGQWRRHGEVERRIGVGSPRVDVGEPSGELREQNRRMGARTGDSRDIASTPEHAGTYERADLHCSQAPGSADRSRLAVLHVTVERPRT